MRMRMTFRALTGIVFVGCAHGAPAGSLTVDPHPASAFSCTRTEPQGDADRCFIDRLSCDSYVAQENSAGVRAAACAEQDHAFCFVGTASERAWICVQDRENCERVREKTQMHDPGTCVERVVAKSP